MIRNEFTELRDNNISPKESVESPSKLFDVFLKNLQVEYTNFIDNAAKVTVRVIYDISLFYNLDDKIEIFKDFITFNKRWRVKLKKD